ncbi:TPA: hypothetical protein RVR74_001894 [Aeromonas salmonicida]|uniref:hypothetical protein n=1 Tax=Aeromonas salmonicida TaxID=645 RepID=UPI00145C0C66|nr:hypothetical protein [Aeromonas salmonicida]MDF8327623.1 hypothetical protein [Aeromonas salmonicida]HEA3089587.1 hypothetical protein [Aeromonas salmonicida]
MNKTTNGSPCRLLSCLFADLIHPETVYANWDVLIGIAKQGKNQCWRGLAGSEKTKNRAVFYNIYEERDLDLGGYQAKRENGQGAARLC